MQLLCAYAKMGKIDKTPPPKKKVDRAMTTSNNTPDFEQLLEDSIAKFSKYGNADLSKLDNRSMRSAWNRLCDEARKSKFYKSVEHEALKDFPGVIRSRGTSVIYPGDWASDTIQAKDTCLLDVHARQGGGNDECYCDDEAFFADIHEGNCLWKNNEEIRDLDYYVGEKTDSFDCTYISFYLDTGLTKEEMDKLLRDFEIFNSDIKRVEEKAYVVNAVISGSIPIWAAVDANNTIKDVARQAEAIHNANVNLKNVTDRFYFSENTLEQELVDLEEYISIIDTIANSDTPEEIRNASKQTLPTLAIRYRETMAINKGYGDGDGKNPWSSKVPIMIDEIVSNLDAFDESEKMAKLVDSNWESEELRNKVFGIAGNPFDAASKKITQAVENSQDKLSRHHNLHMPNRSLQPMFARDKELLNTKNELIAKIEKLEKNVAEIV